MSKENLLKYPMLEEAWRMEMNAAIADAIDKDILTLAAKGLLTHGTNPTNPADETTAAEYLAAIYAGVDGTYASGPSMVRLLVGGTIYQHMAGLLVNTGSATELSVAEKVAAVSGGLFVPAMSLPTRATGRLASSSRGRRAAMQSPLPGTGWK